VNLPNLLSTSRIVVAPLVAWLILSGSWEARLAAFLLFIAASITDYYDGVLARSRQSVTDLGRLLDPLADKLLLLATLVPMYFLQAPPWDPFVPRGISDAASMPFVTPIGGVSLPWYIVAIVLGRELFMTLFRQAAARRQVVIGAIGPAKTKTGFQATWVGAALFWFFAYTLAAERGWTETPWLVFALFNGIVGSVAMIVAVALTLYSFWLYMQRYGHVFTGRAGRQ
jgi:CDP-diacylglycerol---glycerol-3-phosphate 3-phosphatidyltransferase